MPRYFTLRQAEAALPKVESKIREALFLKAEHQRADEELRATSRKIYLSGGANVNRDQIASVRSTHTETAQQIQRILEEIQEQGCLVKDLDIGLLDFPTLYRGEEVYLCWRLGEHRIEYWHGIEEGFRGRKAIDQEFIDNHQAE